jgi:predicted nucleotidyltransferase
VESLDLGHARTAVRAAAPSHPGLRLLVLHGSRARGDARASSDWDFAFMAQPGFDASLLYADLAAGLGTDHVDVADLDHAGGLVRYRAARDGVVLFEAEHGLFDRFWFDAVSFWCDAGPALRAGYDRALERLGP